MTLKRKHSVCGVSLSSLVLLSACLGGGDSPPDVTLPEVTFLDGDVETAFRIGGARVMQTIRDAGIAEPRFGSVTQSIKSGSDITSEVANASFDGEVAELEITRNDGTFFSLNTADHLFYASPALASPVTGRNWFSVILADADVNGITVVRGAVDYDADDTSDWIGGGYWFQVTGDWESGEAVDVRLGTFVDGPEISHDASTPSAGTATYGGFASGVYGFEYGTDVDGVAAGTVQSGEYVGSFQLDANFADGTVSGSISRIFVSGVVIHPNHAFDAFETVELTGYHLDLGSAAINSNGTFKGSSGELSAPPDIEIVESDVSWGGRFSIVDDSVGVARMVAGTHGGHYETAGGSESAFIGAFLGAAETYHSPPDPYGDVYTAFSIGSAEALASIEAAGIAEPRFGSVTQSTKSGSDITSEVANVCFCNDTAIFEVINDNGSSFSLNTQEHLLGVNSRISEMTGRHWQEAVLAGVDANGITVMRGAIDYDTDDVDDWIAGGYWFRVTGSWESGRVDDVRVGAFVDGPEISSQAIVPTTGTATYDGLAAGVYAARYETNLAGVPAGTVESGEYEGKFQLIANFEDRSVSGSVSDITKTGVAVHPNFSSIEAVDQELPGYHLGLGSTSIDEDGTFSGTDGSFTGPPGVSVTESEVSWGGRFSTKSDSVDAPRMVAGTHGGRYVLDIGSTTVFIGAFLGSSGSFQ